jgi:hypothetical protein
MKHLASPSFWESYEKLPEEIRDLADRSFDLLKTNSQHPSLHLKKTGNISLCGLAEDTALLELKLKRDFYGFGSAPTQNMIG